MAWANLKAHLLHELEPYEHGSVHERAQLALLLGEMGFGQRDTVAIMTEILGPAGTCPGFGQGVICGVARDTAGLPEITFAGLDLVLAVGGAVEAIGALQGRLVVSGVRVPSVPRGASTVDEAFHHTFGRHIQSIKQEGLLPGTYATPTRGLTPLQAQIELALPPGRGLPGATIRIDVAGLRAAGYEIPAVTRVSNVVRGPGGRVYSVPGGGYEIRFPYEIPPEFISVVGQ